MGPTRDTVRKQACLWSEVDGAGPLETGKHPQPPTSVYLVRAGAPGANCACVGWKPRLILPLEKETAVSALDLS